MEMSRDLFIQQMIAELENQNFSSSSTDENEPSFYFNPRKSAFDIFRSLCFDFPTVDATEVNHLSTTLMVAFDDNSSNLSEEESTLRQSFYLHPTFISNLQTMQHDVRDKDNTAVLQEAIVSLNGEQDQDGEVIRDMCVAACSQEVVSIIPLEDLLQYYQKFVRLSEPSMLHNANCKSPQTQQKVVGDVKEVVKKSVSSVCAVISSLTIVLSDSDLSVASQSQDSSETSQSLSDYIATIAHLNPSSSTNTSDNGDVSDEGDEVMSHRGIVKNIWVHCALLVQNILCQHNNLILEFLPLLLKSIYGVDEVTSGGVPVGIFPSEAECLLVTTLSILTASFASASGNHEPARLLKPSTSSDMWVGLLSTLRVLLANNCHWLTLMVTICRNMDASAGDPSIATGNGVKYVYAVASALSHILTTQSIQSSKKVGIKLPSISSIWLSSGLLELLLFGETSLPLMDVELYKTLSSIVFFGSLCAYETDNTGKPLTYATLQSKTQSAVRAEYRDIVDVVHRWQHSSLQNNNSNETANGATLIWLTGLLSYRPCAAIAIADRAANVNVDASNAEQQWYKCLSLFLDQIVHYIESQALLLVLEEVAHQVGEDIKPSSPIGEGDKRSDLPTSPHDERVNYSSSSKDGGDGVASSSMVDTSVTVDAPNPSILPEVVTADSPFNADTAPTAQWADELIRGVGENRQKRVLYPWDVDFVFDHLLGEHQHMGFLGSKRGVEEVFDSLACVEWLTTASVSHQEDTSIDSSNSNSTVKNGSTNILVVLQRWLKAISVTLLKEQQWLNGYISQGDQHRQDRLSLLAPLQRHLHRWIRQCKACISKFQNQLQSSKVD